MTKQKQVQANVKKHLLRYGKITDLQCLLKYGGRRLSDCIYRLKKAPHNMNIETIMKPQKNSTAKYAEYKLVK